MVLSKDFLDRIEEMFEGDDENDKNIVDLVKRVCKIHEEIDLDSAVKVCEECGELITSLMQTKTYKNKIRPNGGFDDVFEECGDVIVTIMVLCYRYGGEEMFENLEKIMRYKLVRTINRFENGELV